MKDNPAQKAYEDECQIRGLYKVTDENLSNFYKDVDLIRHNLQKKISRDCGGDVSLFKKESEAVKAAKEWSDMNKDTLKQLLKEHLTIKIETDNEPQYYDGLNGHTLKTRVSLLFDNEEIAYDFSSTTI